jgi:hypothetical protein
LFIKTKNLPTERLFCLIEISRLHYSAHGKRSNVPAVAPPSDTQQQPDSLAPPSDDSPASSWEPIEEPSLSADEYLPAREAAVAWQRLRRPMHQRSRPRSVIRRDDGDDDYEAPPPRWLYQIMVIIKLMLIFFQLFWIRTKLRNKNCPYFLLKLDFIASIYAKSFICLKIIAFLKFTL